VIYETFQDSKKKRRKNVISAIEEARKVPLYRLLIGLSIENIGEETARLMAETFGSLEAMQKAKLEEVSGIHGVGEVVAESLVNWFADEKQQAVLVELLPHITIENPTKVGKSDKLHDKTFVLTGTLSEMTRDEAKDLIRKLGGNVSSSVSKQTTYVLVGTEPGSKKAEAEELGVAMISEEEFLKLVAG